MDASFYILRIFIFFLLLLSRGSVIIFMIWFEDAYPILFLKNLIATVIGTKIILLLSK